LINATSQTIGLLLLTAMDAKTRDVEAVLSDFRRCLNSYETLAQSFLSSSALDVEQVFKVGREVALVAPINRSMLPSSTVAACQANGSLTLVHMFQSSRFVLVSWMRMMPPPYMNELLGEISAEVLINLLLALATGAIGMSAKVLDGIKSRRARQWFKQLARQFGKSRVQGHVEAAKPQSGCWSLPDAGPGEAGGRDQCVPVRAQSNGVGRSAGTKL